MTKLEIGFAAWAILVVATFVFGAPLALLSGWKSAKTEFFGAWRAILAVWAGVVLVLMILD